MPLKRASAFRRMKRAYTRKARVKSKQYVKTIPPSRLVKYTMGNTAKYLSNGYPFVLQMISKDSLQVRDVAIESARKQIHHAIEEHIGNDFYFEVSLYPHQILREHAQAAVAQADRIFQGMSLSFGKCVSLAAQVKEGNPIFIVAVMTKEASQKARQILKDAKQKLPVRIEVVDISQKQ